MKKRVFFGECMVELALRETGIYQQTFAGDTFNTAIYLNRLNQTETVSYLTAVGKDDLSEKLTQFMREEGLGTELVFTSSSRTLGLYMVATDHTGERSFTYWRSQSAARETLPLLSQCGGVECLHGCASFFFSGISLGILSDEDKEKLFALISELKAKGTEIIFDPNYRPLLWDSAEHAKQWTDKAYAVADMAFPGGDDHAVLYGHKTSAEIISHVQALGVNEIIFKNGADGVQVVTPGNHCIVPTFQVDNVVDTTAAGDAFNGGYLAARFAGQSPADAAQLGARTAAFVLGYRGAIVPKDVFSHHHRKIA